jgi:hypothetical protein
MPLFVPQHCSSVRPDKNVTCLTLQHVTFLCGKVAGLTRNQTGTNVYHLIEKSRSKVEQL